MRKQIMGNIKWLTAFIFLVFVAYVVGYLITVSRSVAIDPSSTPQRTHQTVYAEMKGSYSFSSFQWVLFGPALKLDRQFLRRHYWSSWYEIRTATGQTNIVYICDILN